MSPENIRSAQALDEDLAREVIEPEIPGRHRSRLLSILRWISLIAAGVALVFVVKVLVTSWHSLQHNWHHFTILGFSIAIPGAVASLLLVSLTWHWLLRQIGISVSRLDALHAWFTGNLYKYIPGQIWMAVGRTVKGAQSGIPARATLGTTIIEQGFSLLAAGLFLGIASGWLGMIVICGILSGLLLYPRGVNRVIAATNRAFGRSLPLVPLNSSQLLILYGISLLNIALGILIMVGIMWGLGVFHVADIPAYVVAFTSSFLSGYLFFGAPAGLGVREGALVLLLQSEAGIGTGEAALVAVITRIVMIVVELGCYAVVAMLVKFCRAGEQVQ